MGTFAFIVHPLSLKQLKEFWPITKILPGFFIKPFLKHIQPFKLSHIRNVRSSQGIEIQGYFLACPLLPSQMLELEEKFVLDKIISAGRIAERLGVQILGLGGYTSIIADKGYTIARNLKLPVTSGNTLTAWSVLDAIFRLARQKSIDLKKTVVAVIGATGSIGSLCARKLSFCVEKLIINARHLDKLERLKEAILHRNPDNAPVSSCCPSEQSVNAEVVIEQDAHRAVKDADIVVTTTSAPEALLDVKELKSGAIACDISLPRNIEAKSGPRRDITLFEGGLIKLPFPVDFGVDTGLPADIVYGCIAEIMLLTLEEKFISYSLGDNISLENLQEIADIAAKHGFGAWVPEAAVL